MTSPGAHRLALQQLDARAADVPDKPTAEVTAITPGGGSDGQDLVTVLYLGAALQFPHMDHYTPVVGHMVVLDRVGGSWTIVGRPIGFPPST